MSTARSGFLVVSGSTPGGVEHSNFWLKELIQQAKTRSGSTSGEYKAADPCFCGIATQPQHGLVDTAAERGLIGKPALNRLQGCLRECGLRIKWPPNKTSAAKGVGGDAKCLGVAMIPVGVAGVNGLLRLLETTVVDDDVPLLLPVCMLTGLKAVVDLQYMKLYLKEYGVEETMNVLPSGHVTIDVLKFENGKFQMPFTVPGCVQEDFRTPSHEHLQHGGRSYHSAVMAQSNQEQFNSNPTDPIVVSGNGCAPDGTPQESWEPSGSDAAAEGAHGHRTTNPCPQQAKGSSRVARDHGQSDHIDDLRRVQGHRGRLVSTIAALAWLTLGTPGGSRRWPMCSPASSREPRC